MSDENVTIVLCDPCDGTGKKLDGDYCVRCEGYGTIGVHS